MNATSVDATPSTCADLLFELGTEELPPTSLNSLSVALEKNVLSGLKNARLNFDQSTVQRFATPRRLAIIVSGLQTRQQDITVEKLGPAVAAAYDTNGNPTKAAEGFARGLGVTVSELAIKTTDKGDRLCFQRVEIGAETSTLLPKIIEEALNTLPIAKRMRWGSSRSEFVRPIHWVTLLLDSEVVSCNLMGVDASNVSQGHRFHAPKGITIDHPNNYETLLATEGQIVASFDKRKQLIVDQVTAIASTLGGTAHIDNDLLDEVTALVEKPVALAGGFDKQFLSIPHEALIYSMSEHQKYFHVVDHNGNLLPQFITVSNIASHDPAKVISGNERVIRPRLSDAAFFFDTDKKLSLATMRERLKPIVFQQQLGTVYSKTDRIAKLSAQIATDICADPSIASIAGELCKADLASDMVLEFDKMQGIAGGYYAEHDALPDGVAEAIRSHYLPRYAGDNVPTSKEGCAVSLADRLDTLTGIFGIGQEPSGSKDPFALRRAAIGIIQIILQNGLSLDISELSLAAAMQHDVIKDSKKVSGTVTAYILDRFAALYQTQGLRSEIYLAVRASNSTDILDFDARVQAIAQFDQQTESSDLAALNKRVGNILEKAGLNSNIVVLNNNLLIEDAEKALVLAIDDKEKVCLPLFEKQAYQEGMLALTSLKTPINRFFDEVMVNVDDLNLKQNRLALLAKTQRLFTAVADISLL